MKKIIEITWQVELPDGYTYKPDVKIAQSLKEKWQIHLSQDCSKNLSITISTEEQGAYKTQVFKFSDTMK